MLLTSCITPVEARYTITFNSDGGTPIKEQIIKEGTQITTPEAPIKDGYNFNGWYSDEAGLVSWVFSESVNKNIVLFAKWIAHTPISSFTYEIINGNEIEITGFTGIETEVVIPDLIDEKPVINIGKFAFFGCSSLTSITIPEGVTSIGDNALYNCSSLTSITIPASVTSIGDAAFAVCTSLVNINVDTGNAFFVSVDNILFNYDKTKIITYPLGITETTYTIPPSVTTIMERVFDSCTNLISITIPEGVTSIGDHAFRNCFYLSNIIIPTSVISIGDGAFFQCSALISIAIPASVTSIGDGAFSWCYRLTNINVDSGNTFFVSIDNVLFNYEKTKIITYPRGNTSETYIIPASVTTISKHAFAACNLITIRIPDNVTFIDLYAFQQSPHLSSVIIPDSVITIERSVFTNCTNLSNIYCYLLHN